MIEKTMDFWIGRKIGLYGEEELKKLVKDANGRGLARVTREILEQYQLKKLQEMLAFTKQNSPYYAKRLQSFQPENIRCLNDWEQVPFSTPDDLRNYGTEMLCVGQSVISRIVTLETSGTTDKPKRVYYTKEDQELTVDFFDYGMRLMVDERDRVLILLPCRRPGSVGDLLALGLERLGAKAVRYGVIKDYEDAAKVAADENITALVGAPTQVAELAERYPCQGASYGDRSPFSSVKTVLLSVEYVSKQARDCIKKAWHCQVFEHYGMTETGLGGAVFCAQLAGYHPREADLYYEIIDPQSGRVVPDGQFGEVVFTTLTRQAMPLLRYRTGDISRWIPEKCACASILKRLDRVGERSAKKAYL